MSCDDCSLKAVNANKELHNDVLRAFLVDKGHFNYIKNNINETWLLYVSEFNLFDEKHMAAAHETASEIARRPDMINILSTLKNIYHDSHYVDYLARVTLWKNHDTKSVTLPPAHQVLPRLYFGSEILEPGEGAGFGSASVDPVQMLDWWREDPGLAEHHYNWHVYYPFTELTRDRQGELFAYMHKQMLARYDFERLAVGLGRVRAFGPDYTWDKPLEEGYNPRIKGFSFRPSGMLISETTKLGTRVLRTDVLQRNKDMFFYSLARGFMECPNSDKIEITMDNLGNTVEANKGSINKKLYGNLHNNGHRVIAAMNDPDGRYKIDPGPMQATETAPRDPIFFRWHKFVDAIFEEHRVSLDRYIVEDLIMKEIEIESISTAINPSDFSDKENLIDHLYTFMEEKVYPIHNYPQERTVKKNILSHIPFNYRLKVRNTGSNNALLVFRVFLAPESKEPLKEWKNMFVELDKFVESIEAGTELDITRSDKDSSVILPPETTVQDIQEGKIGSQSKCGCGWPLNLLLPRGNHLGMKTNLYVLATNWMEDGVYPQEPLNQSVSYCGKLGSKYPDKRPMGFPFDRENTFMDFYGLVDVVPNSAMTSVTITLIENRAGTDKVDIVDDSQDDSHDNSE